MLDSIIWSSQPDYLLQLVKYVLPTREYKTIQHLHDGRATVSSYQYLYGSEFEGNILLRLLHRSDQKIEEVDQVVLKSI